MATGKRYYWFKLKESFLTSDTVDYFMGLPDGAKFVVLYQTLFLKTINTDGKLARQVGDIVIPYDVDKLKRDCKWFSKDTIREGLNLFRSLGLLCEDEQGTLFITEFHSLVGYETDYAEEKRKQRKEHLKKDKSADNVRKFVRIEKEKEIREKNKREDNKEREYSFVRSCDTSFGNDGENTERNTRRPMYGELGQGVLVLTDEEFDDLCNHLCIEDLEHYCKVVRENEKCGKRYTKKTHNRAIREMAEKDGKWKP